MKKLFTALICATLAFCLGGCGASREPLDSEGVKTNFSNNKYKFTCVASEGDYSCLFSDGKNAFMYMESYGTVFYSEESVYSLEKDKLIDGTADEKKLKETYTEILKSADITADEVIQTLKTEYSNYKETAEKEKKDLENKEYSAGERISIEQNGVEVAAFTFNSATATDKRNQFDDSGAQQVVMINYTVENIDVDDDLYLSSVSMTVMSEDGTTASTYPVSREYAQPCPKGAKSTGDEAYGFKTPTKKIKVRVQMYINSEKVTRTVVLDVQ